MSKEKHMIVKINTHEDGSYAQPKKYLLDLLDKGYEIVSTTTIDKYFIVYVLKIKEEK